MGLRLFACWDCEFEWRRVLECLCNVGLVCCEAEVPETGRSLVQKSCTECGVSECDLEVSTMRRPGPARAVEP
jgi:hypothetical protein